jgi:hypothetical protein
MSEDESLPPEDDNLLRVYQFAADEVRPHQSRRQHQAAIRRREKRKQSRSRRLRALIGIRFWTRTAIGFVILLCLVFWAKFAVVYDIPQDLSMTGLSGVSAYVTEKPWWFGPPAFDLHQTEETRLQPYLTPEDALLQGLGRYSAVVLQPTYVWVLKR